MLRWWGPRLLRRFNIRHSSRPAISRILAASIWDFLPYMAEADILPFTWRAEVCPCVELDKSLAFAATRLVWLKCDGSMIVDISCYALGDSRGFFSVCFKIGKTQILQSVRYWFLSVNVGVPIRYESWHFVSSLFWSIFIISATNFSASPLKVSFKSSGNSDSVIANSSQYFMKFSWCRYQLSPNFPANNFEENAMRRPWRISSLYRLDLHTGHCTGDKIRLGLQIYHLGSRLELQRSCIPAACCSASGGPGASVIEYWSALS